MPSEQEVLAEVERVIEGAAACEQLAQVARMHAAVSRILATLEARIVELVEGQGETP
jgi:hypothetical protein